jgi:hypothetical protein
MYKQIILNKIQKSNFKQALVAHTCNQETEVSRIVVQSQPGQNSSPDPILKKSFSKVTHMYRKAMRVNSLYSYPYLN